MAAPVDAEPWHMGKTKPCAGAPAAAFAAASARVSPARKKPASCAVITADVSSVAPPTTAANADQRDHCLATEPRMMLSRPVVFAFVEL